MDYKDKKVLVCGLARSGVAAAELLRGEGAEVTVQDLKDEAALSATVDLKRLRDAGIKTILGQNPENAASQDLIVLSPGVPTGLGFIRAAMDASVPVIGEFELGSRFCQCPIAAITGTNGKTTTTALLGEIAKSYFTGAQVVGNIGIPFSQVAPRIPRDSYCIAEASSFQLETIHMFKPKIAAVLNITPDHIDRHGSFENYVNAKRRIFENQDRNDYLILNYEDPICREFANEARSKVYFFSSAHKIENGLYLDNGRIISSLDGASGAVVDVNQLHILGKHNYENAMAAILMAVCMGIPQDIIVNKLKGFKAVAHRIEYVTTLNDVKFYNDSKGTNPDAAIKSIEAMDRPIVLIGGGYDKDSDFTAWIESFDGKVKHLVVLGQVASKILCQCGSLGFHKTTKVDTLEEAVQTAFQIAAPGDVVLLSPACASWDMFDNYEQRGSLFKETVFRLN